MANIETMWLIVQVSVYTVFYGSSSFIDTELQVDLLKMIGEELLK